MNNLFNLALAETDPLIANAIDREVARQANGLELIASENFVSEAVLEAAGSFSLTSMPKAIRANAITAAANIRMWSNRRRLIVRKNCLAPKHANVQPHSGAQANMSVYLAAIQYGDTILGMNLSHGGHLTHGHPLNFSGLSYKVFDYGVSRETETIDYDELQRIAEEHKPKLLVCGASAYPRIIDFKRISEICQSIGARMFADIAHIAGLWLRVSTLRRCRWLITSRPRRIRPCAARAAA
jgi:glycine hydroxymethyltransferase